MVGTMLSSLLHPKTYVANISLTITRVIKRQRSITYAIATLVYVTTHDAAYAQLAVTVDQGNTDRISVALPYLHGNDSRSTTFGKDIIAIAQANLEASGYFRVADRRAYVQKFRHHGDLPSFNLWRTINASAVLAGDVSVSDKNISVAYRLWDPYTERQLLGKQFTTDARNKRRLGHIIADHIYEAMTGERGYFDSRIAYISETFDGRKRVKRLAVMDQDGKNHQFITSGSEMALTPRFNAKGDALIYLSYRGSERSLRYLTLASMRPQALRLPGDTAFSPSFAPGGRKAAITISVNGNSDIYTSSVPGGNARRLTQSTAIDTSPSYSPDGRYIVFSSDRSGKPQLYVIPSSGGKATRITFGSGDYNAPTWSPAGDIIAFTKRAGGRFHIGTISPDGTGEEILTTGFMDESPAWSPNGRIIAFSRQSRSVGGRPGESYLYRIDTAGHHLKRIPAPGQGSDPSWAFMQ